MMHISATVHTLTLISALSIAIPRKSALSSVCKYSQEMVDARVLSLQIAGPPFISPDVFAGGELL